MITKKDMLKALNGLEDSQQILISIEDDSKPYPFLRAFGRDIDGVAFQIEDVVIKMLGEFNNDLENPDEEGPSLAIQDEEILPKEHLIRDKIKQESKDGLLWMNGENYMNGYRNGFRTATEWVSSLESACQHPWGNTYVKEVGPFQGATFCECGAQLTD